MENGNGRLIDAAELAKRLSVSVAAVRLWCRTTDLPKLRLGRLVRFDYDAVRAWLERRSESRPAA